MNKRNIVLIDSSAEEGKDFIQGLKDQTGKEWELIVEASNDRRTKGKELMRYLKYFWVPFRTFINRDKYDVIVAWQQFYGIMFAFYCRLFRVKKKNKLIVMSFIYKEKKGLVGKLYKWLIDFVVKGEYVDAFTSVASIQCDKFSKEFGVPINKFQFIPWGITDIAPDKRALIKENHIPYFFCAGRSNRDWNIVFESFGKADIPCRFIYSDSSYANKFKNIELFSNVPDEEYFSLSINSDVVVVSIDNCNLAGGEITIINAMQFGKPVILIQDNPHNDYVFEGVTGYVVPKDSARVIEVAAVLYNNRELRDQMALNARKYYEERFSIYSVGKEIGALCSI